MLLLFNAVLGTHFLRPHGYTVCNSQHKTWKKLENDTHVQAWEMRDPKQTEGQRWQSVGGTGNASEWARVAERFTLNDSSSYIEFPLVSKNKISTNFWLESRFTRKLVHSYVEVPLHCFLQLCCEQPQPFTLYPVNLSLNIRLQMHSALVRRYLRPHLFDNVVYRFSRNAPKQEIRKLKWKMNFTFSQWFYKL